MRTLTINNTDVSTLGATLLTVDYGYSTVITYKDWLRGTHSPLFYEQETHYTTAEYKFLVEAANRKALDTACSNLVALARKGKYQVTDCDWYIDGNIVEAEDNNISPLAREVTIRVEGIKTEPGEFFDVVPIGETVTFTPKGNCEVPVKIRILPDQGYTTYTLTLNGKDYIIKNLTTVSYLDIDGINGTVDYGGGNKIEDYLAWEFPTIIGGQENTIALTGGSVRIEYDGRWV